MIKLIMLLSILNLTLAQFDSIPPIPKIPFELNYYDIRQAIHSDSPTFGKINVIFDVNELGKVENAIIKDSFNIDFNTIVLDKVRQMRYHPAIQNGKPVKVRYNLPIQFK